MTPTLDRARQYIRWSYLGAALLCALPAVAWSMQLQPWEPYLLSACVAATLLQAARWEQETAGPFAFFACALTLAAWVAAVATGAHPAWVWPAMFAVSMTLRDLGDRYLTRVVAIIAVVGTATALGAVIGRTGGWNETGWMVAVFVLVMATPVLFTDWTWRLFCELDDAREAAGELAVASERLRFAADLHDIQGHTLQTIALKSELARRIAQRDPHRAAEEMAAIEDLARRALAETREVVHDYRQVSLRDELANAEQVLTAAGIDVESDEAPELDGDRAQVLGLVVREATTNIIRHARARTVTFEAGPGTLTIRNDGVGDTPAGDGSGIAGLRERLAAVGGSLSVSSGAGMFEVVAEIGGPDR